MKDCLFCQIYKDRAGANLTNKVVYFGKSFYLHFDDVPISPGHLEIVSKRHIKSLVDLNLEEWQELKGLLKKAKKIIEDVNLKDFYKKFLDNADNKIFKYYAREMLRNKFLGKKPAGYNVGVNEGSSAGQTIQHLYIHIIPRYTGDVDDPTGGVRNVIHKLGNYKKLIK